MRILTCHIEDFGKMHQIECSLKEGLNILNEPNGWGKTTFAVFVTAMFYGCDGQFLTLEGCSSIRHDYMPWNGNTCGGYVIFESAGKKYKLERTFGTDRTQDTFSLKNADTGILSSDYTENIGEELFGINNEEFTGSVYLQSQSFSMPYTDNLSDKLLGMIEDGNYGHAYEDTVRKLKRADRELGKKDTSGMSAIELDLKKCRATSVNLVKWQNVLKEAVQRREDRKNALEASEDEMKVFTEQRLHEGKHTISFTISVIAFIVGLGFLIAGAVFQVGFPGSTKEATIVDGIIIFFFGMLVMSFRHKWQKNVDSRYHKIQQKVDECRKAYEAIFGEEEALRKKIEELSTDASRVGMLADELESGKRNEENALRRQAVYEKTMDYLSKAREQMREKYSEKLDRTFKKYIEVFGDIKEGKNLSTGYRDIVGLCARFAIIDTLFEKEKPVILLDDPFVNLDSEKFGKSLELVRSAAEEHQIIYLTCNGSRTAGQK